MKQLTPGNPRSMASKMRRGAITLLAILLLLSMPIIHAAELQLTYDANGNLVSGDGKYRVYNDLNELWKIYNGSSINDPLLEEYYFHPMEERILQKIVYHTNGSVKENVYYITKNLVRISNDTGTFDFRYIYHEGTLIAQQNPDGSKLFIHSNHEGSVSVVSNSTGDVIENTIMTPFGEVLSGGTTTRYGYENKEHDTIVGDTDFNFRKYKPEWALFLQPDDVIQNIYDPQSLNRYSFERNNPYRYVDPSGHFIDPITDTILFVAAVAIIFVIVVDLFATFSGQRNVDDDTYVSSAPEYSQIPSGNQQTTDKNQQDAKKKDKTSYKDPTATYTDIKDSNGNVIGQTSSHGVTDTGHHGQRPPANYISGVYQNPVRTNDAETKTPRVIQSPSNPGGKSWSPPRVGSSYTTSRGVTTTIASTGRMISGGSYSISSSHKSSYGY